MPAIDLTVLLSTGRFGLVPAGELNSAPQRSGARKMSAATGSEPDAKAEPASSGTWRPQLMAKKSADTEDVDALVDALPYVDAIGAEASWRPRVEQLVQVQQ